MTTMMMNTMMMDTMMMDTMMKNTLMKMVILLVKVDLVPCTQYKFKVAAYEFFHGTGKIFPVWSKEVGMICVLSFFYLFVW